MAGAQILGSSGVASGCAAYHRTRSEGRHDGERERADESLERGDDRGTGRTRARDPRVGDRRQDPAGAVRRTSSPKWPRLDEDRRTPRASVRRPWLRACARLHARRRRALPFALREDARLSRRARRGPTAPQGPRHQRFGFATARISARLGRATSPTRRFNPGPGASSRAGRAGARMRSTRTASTRSGRRRSAAPCPTPRSSRTSASTRTRTA